MHRTASVLNTATAARVSRTSLIAYGILALTLSRLAVAWATPLAGDEAYYWLWSKHLAGGYYDHPPMVALLIKASTAAFGDTEFGVRALSILLGLLATWAVWRSAAILFADENVGATAALYFNLTMFVAAGTAVVTPDAPLIVVSALVLFFLAKVWQTGRGEWWLAVGAASGAALLSKYSALFLGLGILIWLLAVPSMRRWLLTPWPWLGGLVALALFAPVIVWNAENGWVSFLKQFGRAVHTEFSPHYLGEHLAAQFGMVTPAVFVLGTMGLFAFIRGQGPRAARVLLGAMVWPLAIYFLWHSLHSRVEGDWTAPLIPAFAVAAAAASEMPYQGAQATLAMWSRVFAVPAGVALIAFVYLQAAFGLIPADHLDPTARQLGAGWVPLARQIDALRREAGADAVIGTNYGTVSWLAFYLPGHTPVVQVNERIRWVNAPEPDRRLFEKPLLYVCKAPCDELWTVIPKFGLASEPVTLQRTRHGVVIEDYLVWRLDGLDGELLDRSPPPELRDAATQTAAAPDR